MLRPLLAVALLAAAAAAQLAPELQPLEPFVGRTWKALVNPDAGLHDVARWEPALAGQAVRIVHSVGDGAYGGETFVMWDRERESLVYTYFTTAGFYTRGTMSVDEEGRVHSREVVTGNESGVEEVHSISALTEDGRLRVTTRMRRGETWEEAGDVFYEEAPDAEVVLPATAGSG